MSKYATYLWPCYNLYAQTIAYDFTLSMLWRVWKCILTTNKYRAVFWVRFVDNEQKHSRVDSALSFVHPSPNQITSRINVVYCAVDCGTQTAKSWSCCLYPEGIKLLGVLRHNISFLSAQLLSFLSENTSGGLLNNDSNMMIVPAFYGLRVSDYNVHILWDRCKN